jgi:hypothetical protein
MSMANIEKLNFDVDVGINMSPISSDPSVSEGHSLGLKVVEDLVDDTVDAHSPEEEQPKSINSILQTETSPENIADPPIDQEKVLIDTLARFTLIHTKYVSEADDESLLPNTVDTKSAHCLIFGNPRTDSSSLTARILESPRPPLTHDFVNTDYTLDPDGFKLELGLAMSRSNSIDSLHFEPESILFSNIDQERDVPRVDTPTKTLDLYGISETLPGFELIQKRNVVEELSANEELLNATAIQFDRNEIIALICKNLELKERYSTRNVSLQNKLAEHFKRKRVNFA